MEKTYRGTGLNAEQMTDLTMELVVEILNQIDWHEIMNNLKAKHPEFSEEATKELFYDESDIQKNIEDGLNELLGPDSNIRETIIQVFEAEIESEYDDEEDED